GEGHPHQELPPLSSVPLSPLGSPPPRGPILEEEARRASERCKGGCQGPCDGECQGGARAGVRAREGGRSGYQEYRCRGWRGFPQALGCPQDLTRFGHRLYGLHELMFERIRG